MSRPKVTTKQRGRAKVVVKPKGKVQVEEPAKVVVPAKHRWANKHFGTRKDGISVMSYTSLVDSFYHENPGEIVRVDKAGLVFFVRHFPEGLKPDDSGAPTEYMLDLFVRVDTIVGDVELASFVLSDGDEEFDIYCANDAYRDKAFDEEGLWAFVLDLIQVRKDEGRIPA